MQDKDPMRTIMISELGKRYNPVLDGEKNHYSDSESSESDVEDYGTK